MRFLIVSHLYLIFFSFLLFQFLSFQTSQAHDCLLDQQLALLQFKNDSLSESSSPTTSKLESWKPNTDCCSWEGITCDEATGHVISLNISQRNLEGRLDSNSSLFKLHSLLKLDLSGNFIQSSMLSSGDNMAFTYISETTNSSSSKNDQLLIPSGFSQLANLTHLSLSSTGFSGQIPLAISHLTRLVSLDLSSNNLKLENPNLKMLIQNMYSLRELRLGGVDMSRQNSNWCEALSSAVPHLRVLSLQDCSLSGPIDSSLSNLWFLSEIDLGLNNISSEVPRFLANFTSLVSLDLGNCDLQGEFPKDIFKLPDLRVVNLWSNPNLRASFPHFPEQSALEWLYLSDTKSYGELPESIGNLKNLSVLSLGNCNFSGRIPISISNLIQLSNLDLSSNNFSGSIPSLLPPKIMTEKFRLPEAGLLSLEYLNLQNNSLDGVINYELFALPSLEVLLLNKNHFYGLPSEVPNMPFPILRTLDLSENKFLGPIPRVIFELRSIEGLSLSSNDLSGIVELDKFSILTNLSYLDLSDNNWSVTSGSDLTLPKLWKLVMHSCGITEFPSFLRNIPGLDFLDLSNNKIEGHIPNWIWMSHLSYLNLSLNSLTGLAQPLPHASSLELISIDLHSNKLEGPIPVLSYYATFLDYSNNNFTSIFPLDIGYYISNATFFSVSRNKLVGEIPGSICMAYRLQVLDLSNNNFKGTIPTCLGNFSDTLSVLNLGGNTLQGTMPQGYASSLRSVVFNENQLEGNVPRSLSACQSLEVLDIGNNQISDTFPFWLENLPKLRVLVLRSNRFHGPIVYPRMENAFPMLHVIDLSFNAFVGDLPSEYFHEWKAMKNGSREKNSKANYLGSKYYQDSVTVTIKGHKMLLVKILTIFSTVDFSSNGFEGSIPESIGELASLHLLNLSHNILSGHIPSSLGKLQELESLDLSENKLSG